MILPAQFEEVVTADTIIQISTLINVIGLVQSFTLSFTLLATNSHNKLNRYISGLSFVLAIIIGNTLLTLHISQDSFVFYQSFTNSVAFLIGPILYLLVDKSLSRDKKEGAEIYHYIPSIAYLLLSILSTTIKGFSWFIRIESFILLWLWHGQILLYLTISFKKIQKISFKPQSDGYWLKRLIKYFLYVSLLNLALSAIHELIIPIPDYISLNITVLLSFIVVGIVFKSQKSPIHKLAQPVSGQDGLIEKLLILFEQEKIYRSQELTLNSVAQQLDLNSRLLSSLINNRFGKNFNEFINEFRIKEVIQKIDNKVYEQFTIMAIAEEAGFKSNTAFYRSFKSVTGLTPKAYIEKKLHVTNHDL